MDGEMILQTVLINLAITCVAYLFVPMVCILFHKRYSAKVIKRIATINSIVVWLLFRILQAELVGEVSSGGAVVLWGGIGYFLLKKFCTEEDVSDIDMEQGLSDVEMKTHCFVSNVVQKNAKPTEHQYQEAQAAKRWPNCGDIIDSETQKCTGCGKQYFKGISRKAVLIGLGVFCLVVSLVINVVLAVMLQKKPDYIVQSDESFSEWAERQELQEKADFLDTYVVLVEDDGTNLYHQYGCSRFKMDEFWAFNVDYAQYMGYTACPYCIE